MARKKNMKIEFLISINQSSVQLKHTSSDQLWVVSDQHHIENWLVMLYATLFLAIFEFEYACNETLQTEEDTEKKNTQGTALTKKQLKLSYRKSPLSEMDDLKTKKATSQSGRT